ncbi:Mannosyl-oligosaccharide 1,2-alpha-mannosidase IA [Physocladia obscura]|uniref:alpha-1,2-Mannosidase n=1 Tax=Physocladia obscura TaxID=109957 RepID=A0AAD5XF24_9FUNG|nr:Mannosyl-oligosaccharide 1,2-alpha-mannosidase IA [Physocladia obscura]
MRDAIMRRNMRDVTYNSSVYHGLNLPLFLATGRESRDQEKMDFVKQMMIHAWTGYKEFAWGYDDLNPISQTPWNWYKNVTLLNTPVDALDTLFIMDLKEEYAEAKQLILETLDFANISQHVSVFETNIRILGGLLAAFDLEGDVALLNKSIELADRLLPAFDTPTGIPKSQINLATGKFAIYSSSSVILAELGTLQLEFQYLSDITGNSIYAQKALYVYEQMQTIKMRIPGLFPEYLDVDKLEYGENPFLITKVSVGGMADSYYEYLLKLWLSTGEEKYFNMYYTAAQSIAENMVVKSDLGHLYIPTGFVKQVGAAPRDPRPPYNSDATTAKAGDSSTAETPEVPKYYVAHDFTFEHLACFTGGMMATGALASREGNWTHHLYIASEITETCWKMYNNSATGIGSESCDGKTLSLYNSRYILRPEAVESLFYFWRYTHNQIYRDRAWSIAKNIEKYCRDETGYHGLENAGIIPTSSELNAIDRQESFFLAETLKYLYLIFTDDDTIPLEKYVFNTEAHPLSVRGHGRRKDPSKFTPLPPAYDVAVGQLRNITK